MPLCEEGAQRKQEVLDLRLAVLTRTLSILSFDSYSLYH